MPVPLTSRQVTQIDSNTLQVVLPEEYELPEELKSQPPRRVPDEFYRCKQIRRPFVASWVLVAAFLISIVAGARPIGQPWAQIAFWTMAIFGILGTVGIFTTRRELRYIQDGLAGAGRVTELELVPAMDHNGQTIALKHVITMALELSDTTVATREFRGLDIPADGTHQADIQLGDVLPFVWLPGQFLKTAKPYAFLNFNHDRVLTRQTREPNSVWKKVGTGLAVVAIFAILICDMLLLMWCVPVSMSVPVVALIAITGGLLLGGAMFGGIIFEFRREDQRMEERNERAIAEGHAIQMGSSHAILTNTWKGWGYRILIGAGSLLLGGLTAVLWSFGGNQILDTAPSVERTIEILEVKEIGGRSRQTRVVFRPIDEATGEYSKEYGPRDLPKIPLFAGQQVTVEWHAGAFGWPWIGDLKLLANP